LSTRTVTPPLTPDQRSLRARIAALALHEKVDGRAHTEPARAASPGQAAFWDKKVDPDGVLPEPERARRAAIAKRRYFSTLALKSARARALRAQSF
jgi:hypothetical protein